MARIAIGIPVYNEERNIGQLIQSIERQSLQASAIDRVIICDDGSTDCTVQVVEDTLRRSEWLKQVTFFEIKSKNEGKSAALQSIFREYLQGSAEYLLLLDSDMVMERNDVISALLQSFSSSKDVAMVGGWYMFHSHPNPLFRVLRFSLEVIKNLGNSKKAFVCSGGILCLSREFVQSIDMPIGITRIDLYLYLQAVSSGMSYVFQPEAVVVDTKDFSTLGYSWFARIQGRSTAMPNYLIEKYGKEALRHHTHVSFFVILRALFSSFCAYPVDSLCYLAYKLAAITQNVVKKGATDVLWRN